MIERLVRSGRSERAVVAAVLVLCTLVCYGRTLTNELVSDDRGILTQSPLLRSPWDLSALALSPYWTGLLESAHYRPLTTWTLALNYWTNECVGLPGPHATSYHVLNLLLHAGCCYLVWRVGRELVGMTQLGGLLAALYFCVHPIHTEAVTFITGRAEPLAAAWGLAYLILHWQGRWGLACVALALALLAKESAIGFIGVAPLLGTRPDLEGRPWRPLAAYALTVAAWLALRAAVIGALGTDAQVLDNPLAQAGALTRVLTAAAVQVNYLVLQAVPVHLSTDYSYAQVAPLEHIMDWRLGVFVLLVGAAVALWWPHGRYRDVALGRALGAYAVLAVPTGNFLLLSTTIMGERLVYAPSIFLALFIGHALTRDRKVCGCRTRGALAALGLGALIVLTVQRNGVWETRESFCVAQCAGAPRSARAHVELGTLRAEQGRLDSARTCLQDAVRIHPQYALAWNNLGLVAAQLGEVREADAALKRAVSIAPAYWKAWVNLGELRGRNRDFSGAARALEQALRLQPGHADIWSDLGAARMQLGDAQAAREAFGRALAIDPQHAAARANLQLMQQ